MAREHGEADARPPEEGSPTTDHQEGRAEESLNNGEAEAKSQEEEFQSIARREARAVVAATVRRYRRRLYVVGLVCAALGITGYREIAKGIRSFKETVAEETASLKRDIEKVGSEARKSASDIQTDFSNELGKLRTKVGEASKETAEQAAKVREDLLAEIARTREDTLGNVAKECSQLMGELGKLQQDVDKAAQDVLALTQQTCPGLLDKCRELNGEATRLAGRIDRLQKMIKAFERVVAGTGIAPPQEKGDNVRELLAKITARIAGMDESRTPAPVEVVMQGSFNSVVCANGKLYLGEHLLGDHDAIAYEVSFYDLFEVLEDREYTSEFAGIASGFADYITCTLLDDPVIGQETVKFLPRATSSELCDRGYVRRIDRLRTFVESDMKTADTPVAGEFWGSVFWAIHTRLPDLDLDAVVWQALRAASDSGTAPGSTAVFLRELVGTAKEKGGDTAGRTVAEVIKASGVPF